jgi:hypothetical protein
MYALDVAKAEHMELEKQRRNSRRWSESHPAGYSPRVAMPQAQSNTMVIVKPHDNQNVLAVTVSYAVSDCRLPMRLYPLLTKRSSRTKGPAMVEVTGIMPTGIVPGIVPGNTVKRGGLRGGLEALDVDPTHSNSDVALIFYRSISSTYTL